MMVPGPSSPPIASMAIRISQRFHKGSACGGTLWTPNVLGFVDGTDLTAFVVTAVRADLVRCLRFAALRTRPHRDRAQRVVRAPLGCPRLGMAAFGIRHV